jgi:transcriptional regulator with XRE-family HTH domain
MTGKYGHMTTVRPIPPRTYGLPSEDMLPQSEPKTRFGSLLREYRERCRPYISQSRLAAAMGVDHSYISRLEAGNREPSRAAVLRACIALNLGEVDSERLLNAAGFTATEQLEREPVIADLSEFLSDQRVHAEIREDVRNMMALLIRQARRANDDVRRNGGVS